MGGEGVHHRCRRIGDKCHVGFVDRLPARDRRSVELKPVLEHIVVDGRYMLRYVLKLATRVGEAKIDVFNVVLLNQRKDVRCISHEFPHMKKG